MNKSFSFLIKRPNKRNYL